MPAGAKIFERVMQKRIGNTEYWRKIEIVEEGPFVFRVVQDQELRPLESQGKPETSNIQGALSGCAQVRERQLNRRCVAFTKARTMTGFFRREHRLGVEVQTPRNNSVD